MPEKLYSKFSPDHDFSEVDYFVVGSGIGGLSAAVFLAKAGKKVVVLERHYVPGGFSHTFKRKDGFEWDVGIHYVGNLNEDGSQLKVLFNYLTDNRLKWEYMGDVYDKAIIDGDEYLFPSGRENLIQQLLTYFPEEREALTTYFNLVEKAASRAKLYFAEKILPPLLRHTMGRWFKHSFNAYSSISTYDQLKKITGNEKLISVLCAQCGNYGLPPRQSSFAAHALVVNHFLDGGYYPVGGASEIYRNIIETLNENGGQVYIKAEVQEIITRNKRVEGLQVNGHFIPCNRVISNAGASNTFLRLLKKGVTPKWKEALSRVKPSTPHLCLYLGLDGSDEELELPRHNVWYYDNYQLDKLVDGNLKAMPDKMEFAYISFPSAKDPAWRKKHPRKATVQAISVGNYEWFRQYEDKPWRNRGEIYEQMKEEFKKKMLAHLFYLYPQLEGRVVASEVSTPLSTRHFMNYRHGEIYGLAHTPERFDLKSLRPKTSIKGLYLVGQDISIVGVAGAMTSGMLCAIEILKFRIQRQFRDMARHNNGG